jgi:hypothetical protein
MTGCVATRAGADIDPAGMSAFRPSPTSGWVPSVRRAPLGAPHRPTWTAGSRATPRAPQSDDKPPQSPLPTHPSPQGDQPDDAAGSMPTAALDVQCDRSDGGEDGVGSLDRNFGLRVWCWACSRGVGRILRASRRGMDAGRLDIHPAAWCAWWGDFGNPVGSLAGFHAASPAFLVQRYRQKVQVCPQLKCFAPARVSGSGPSLFRTSGGRVSGWSTMPTWRLPHRLHRKRRSNSPTVASPDPMKRSAARTLIGAEWPQPVRPWQPAENQSEFSIGR